MLGLTGCGRIPVIGKQKLISYEENSGGGMEGGGNSVEVYTRDGETFLTVSSSRFWYTDNTVGEYRVGDDTLAKIEKVFRKHRLQRWNRKKFTNIFIADGESHGYSFEFDGDASVYFSSQYYPARYRKVLNRFSAILMEARMSGTLLPGLVTEEHTDEDVFEKDRPKDGKVSAEVFEYSHNRLRFRLKNGTDEPVSVSGTVRILRDSDGAVLYESVSDESYSIDPNSSSEDTVEPEKRLEAGNYTFEAGELSCPFEIALPAGDDF